MMISRWKFAAVGAHAGNHYASEGVQLGIRYNSQLTVGDENLQGRAPVENSPNLYLPDVVVGGRLPHIRLNDQR